MAANPTEGTAVTSHPPQDQGTSLILSARVTAQLSGCYFKAGEVPRFSIERHLKNIQYGATAVPQQLGPGNCSQGIPNSIAGYFRAPPCLQLWQGYVTSLKSIQNYSPSWVRIKVTLTTLCLLKLLRKKLARKGGNPAVSILGEGEKIAQK